MENKDIARVLNETADLMEIAAMDGFRIRSYRNAAQAVETWTESVAAMVAQPEWKQAEKLLTAIPGIGKSMAAHIRDLVTTGKISVREEILAKFPPTILDLLEIQGLGAKRIALIWDVYKAGSVEEVEKLAKEGKLAELPRMGSKLEQNILKSIDRWKTSAGRFLISVADRAAQQLRDYLAAGGGPGVTVTQAGSLRRGKETIGDLDILVTGGDAGKQMEHLLAYPGTSAVVARGENKLSLLIADNMQVDVRFLDRDSYGSAMQYFTGSKEHNVTLRQRALRMGYTLSEYGLFKVSDESRVAGRTEEEIYQTLGLDYIPPELRENVGEIDAAAEHKLPVLVEKSDVRGDLHTHTTASDGKCSILEMAREAQARGLEYIAITDHSKGLAMVGGLDEKRVFEQVKEIRAAEKEMDGFRIFAGIEVDIHKDGVLDLDDEALAALDVVVASVHSHLNLEAAEQTDRLLKACENRYLAIMGHPSGRLLLRRDAFPFDVERVLDAAAKAGIKMEINASPERLDLSARHARMAKERGIPLVISTDAHHPTHFDNLRFGVTVARRAWLERGDVLNTLPAAEFIARLRL